MQEDILGRGNAEIKAESVKLQGMISKAFRVQCGWSGDLLEQGVTDASREID